MRHAGRSNIPTDAALRYRVRKRLFAKLDELRSTPAFPVMADDDWAAYQRFMWRRYLSLYDAPSPEELDRVNRWIASSTPTEWPGWDALLHEPALQLAFDRVMRG